MNDPKAALAVTLKACPFCGGEVHYNPVQSPKWISCIPCGLTVRIVTWNQRAEGQVGDVDKVVRDLLWHIEQVLGPISTEDCEIPGDSDRGIIEHNFRAIISALHPTPPAVAENGIREAVGKGEMSVRNQFEQRYKHLDLEKVADPWGKPTYKHSHIGALWEGWCGGAAVTPSPEPHAGAVEREALFRIIAGVRAYPSAYNQAAIVPSSLIEPLADAVLTLIGKPGDRHQWRHIKRGTIYTEIGRAELQMTFDSLVDGSSMVVYRGEDGKLWVREESEFEDGRFEPANLIEGAK